jgi:hypothetical protein
MIHKKRVIKMTDKKRLVKIVRSSFHGRIVRQDCVFEITIVLRGKNCFGLCNSPDQFRMVIPIHHLGRIPVAALGHLLAVVAAVAAAVNQSALAQAILITGVLAAVFVTRNEVRWFVYSQGGTVLQCGAQS